MVSHSRTLDAFVDGLADGMPILIHERWHPSFTFVVSMEVRNALSSPARNVSSSAPSQTTASGESVVNFGFTTFLDSMFFSESPTLAASLLPTTMNFQTRPF